MRSVAQKVCSGHQSGVSGSAWLLSRSLWEGAAVCRTSLSIDSMGVILRRTAGVFPDVAPMVVLGVVALVLAIGLLWMFISATMQFVFVDMLSTGDIRIRRFFGDRSEKERGSFSLRSHSSWSCSLPSWRSSSCSSGLGGLALPRRSRSSRSDRSSWSQPPLRARLPPDHRFRRPDHDP